MKPTEHQEQCVVIDWWNHYAPTKGLDVRLLMAIPNGAHLAGDAKVRAIKMNKMKREGLRVGAPDLLLTVAKHGVHNSKSGEVNIIWPEVAFYGMFIEMKRQGETARPNQIEFAHLLRQQGYNVVIAQGADEAMRAIKGYIES